MTGQSAKKITKLMQTPDAKDISKSAEIWLTAEWLTDLGCIQRQRYERMSIHTQEQRWCRNNLLREFPTFWRKVCHVFFSSASSFLRMWLTVKISESQSCWEVRVWLRWVFLWARALSERKPAPWRLSRQTHWAPYEASYWRMDAHVRSQGRKTQTQTLPSRKYRGLRPTLLKDI